MPPLDHRDFLALAGHARLIVSDSGGVQEECTVLKRPMIVVRNSLSGLESVEAGFAELVQPGPAIGEAARRLIDDRELSERLAATPCPFGDGTASHGSPHCCGGSSRERTRAGFPAVPSVADGKSRCGSDQLTLAGPRRSEPAVTNEGSKATTVFGAGLDAQAAVKASAVLPASSHRLTQRRRS